MNQINEAKYYLSGRGIRDVIISDNLKMSDIMNDFVKVYINPERENHKFYSEKLGIAHRHGFKSFASCFVSFYNKTRTLKELSKILKLSVRGINAIAKKYKLDKRPNIGNTQPISKIIKIFKYLV